MVGFSTVMDVATRVAKSGIKEDGQIVALLEAAGLSSGDDMVQVIKNISSNLFTNVTNPAVPVAVNTFGTISRGVSGTAGAITSFLVEHPKTTLAIGAAVAGTTALGAYELNQKKADALNPNTVTFTTDSKGNPIVLPSTKPGTQPAKVVTTQDTNPGILGTLVADLSYGLFGDTPSQVASAVESAKPWLIGGGVLVAIVAVGYTINAVRGNKQTLKVTV